ncbi:DUF1732 domain-containing protein [Myxococcota bacterium]|nr:DUF1732 domain-containing protein [Myxococcota bacterium]MBU1537218.1 DUF1732 domain-containing protein [Myxococcota bacterium]
MAPRSMTGFGTRTCQTENISFTLELRTLNSRYKDIRIKTSLSDGALEYLMRTALDKEFSRGRLDLAVEARSEKSGEDTLLQELEALSGRLPSQEPSLTDILLLRIVRTLERGHSLTITDTTRKSVVQTLGLLMEDVHQSRIAEGLVMVREMERILNDMKERTAQIKERAQGEGARFRERFSTKLAQVINSDMDQISLEREISIMIEKADINEELSRLTGHLNSFLELLTKDGVLGRNMEFLCQELLRETNTVGSKTQDLTISTLGVAMKNDVERLRELSANME